ncbi:WhiB family transcriptional regulator [Mycolicibacterium sp.]|uniref:WhiB family transcriptional regulator n=1 Tax=Mycolicibacterium sp. TaxID=2320850 RepID=UPI0037CA4D52
MSTARVEPGWLSLACEVLRNMPAMRDAACVRHRELFDKAAAFANPAAVAACARICAECPMLSRCRDWARSQRGLDGVFGGELYPKYRTRKRPQDQTHSETG